jgi:hypothetical protein
MYHWAEKAVRDSRLRKEYSISENLSSPFVSSYLNLD